MDLVLSKTTTEKEPIMGKEKKRLKKSDILSQNRVDAIWRKLQSRVERELQNYKDPVLQARARLEIQNYRHPVNIVA